MINFVVNDKLDQSYELNFENEGLNISYRQSPGPAEQERASRVRCRPRPRCRRRWH